MITMNIKKQLGKKIREIRLSSNYTQEALAEKLNISAKSLSQIELGNNFVSADTLDSICSILNVEPKKLFTFEEDILSNDMLSVINEKLIKNKNLQKTIYKIVLSLDD